VRSFRWFVKIQLRLIATGGSPGKLTYLLDIWWMRSSSLNGGGFILHNFLHKIKPILKRNGLFVPEELSKVKKILRTMGLKILVKKDKEFVAKTMVLPAMDRESGIRIDFTFSCSLYERQAIERAKAIKLGRTSVRFASLEDLVIHKVIAGRARDLEDVRSILIKNPKYDSPYIEKWLAEFDKSLGEHFLKVFRSIEKEIR
jgi:hypothetical protein